MSNDKFPLLRQILKAIGLSSDAIDDLIARVVELLGEKNPPAPQNEWPYHLRDDFLSAAEFSFFRVLQEAVADWAIVCPKVSLADLFYAKSSDYTTRRIYTNKIDRKHVDFLLCDPRTARPLIGIELDDKSHQREDRVARDEFVAGVFAAARLPLARVPVKTGYSVAQLDALLRQQAGIATASESATPPAVVIDRPAEPRDEQPLCPKCNGRMVLRVAKSGSNAGRQFWGCPNYPRCRGMLSLDAPAST